MMFSSFSLSRLPRIEFGAGSIDRVAQIAVRFGRRALIVTGGSSLRKTLYWEKLLSAMKAENMEWESLAVTGEPSPQLIDESVSILHDRKLDVVIGIGGGSVLDAAKAIAGLLQPGNSVLDHLEGVGPELPYCGPSTPFIAIPTTAGTGSEATKNAVLSVQGEQGFKKSFRDEQLVARYAIVDPDLLASCPRELIAANGMDAFTQLLESFVSIKANPFTDALARSGLEAVRDGLLPWYATPDKASEARARMAYAALLSGITLAQVGLGSVHGLASPLGAFFPIPHGVVCGTLVAEATRLNIAALQQRMPESPALARYAEAGRILTGEAALDDASARERLIALLDQWTNDLDLPRLNRYGVTPDDVERVVAHCRGSSMKTNPIVLTDDEVAALVRSRL